MEAMEEKIKFEGSTFPPLPRVAPPLSLIKYLTLIIKIDYY
jgi:hypothetical protein